MAELTLGGFFAPPPSNIGYARTPSKMGLKSPQFQFDTRMCWNNDVINDFNACVRKESR